MQERETKCKNTWQPVSSRPPQYYRPLPTGMRQGVALALLRYPVVFGPVNNGLISVHLEDGGASGGYGLGHIYLPDRLLCVLQHVYNELNKKRYVLQS